MSRIRNSHKQKNKDVENAGIEKQDIELTEFPKYSILANELRYHILTYCTKSTRWNYSQCSETCNSEIQRFNTKPPKELKITEERDGVVVKLSYGYEKQIRKTFVYSVASNTMEEIRQYLLKIYKYVTHRATSEIEVDVTRWPLDVMKIRHIVNIERWRVTIYKSMFDDCLQYLKTTRVSKLILEDDFYDFDRVTLQPEFFKTEFFKSLPEASIYLNGSIEREDFMNSLQKRLCLCDLVNIDDIRAKIEQWNSTIHLVDRKIKIYKEEGDFWNVYDIYPMEQFDSIELDDDDEVYNIGKVSIWTEDDDWALVLSVQKD